MTAPIKSVLFDLDGTLVDTAPDLSHAANHVRQNLGLEPLPLALYRPMASAGARGLLRTALNITPEHEDFSAHRQSFLSHYQDNLSRNSRLFAGMDATLRELERRGVRWGVVTNKPKLYTRALMRDLDLERRAAVTISADEVPRPKPAPDSLLTACSILRLTPDDCVYVGDDKRDMDAARAAGMRCVAVTWGYEGEHPISSWAADFIIHQPKDLLSLL
jgi:phosphoglycolate phosphatase